MNPTLPSGAESESDAARHEPIAPYIVLGMAQGIALWALYPVLHDRPGPIGPLFAAMLQFALAAPLARYLLAANFRSSPVRAGVVSANRRKKSAAPSVAEGQPPRYRTP
jgi:hypothetical protein